MERGRLARQQVQNRRARISAERRAVVRQSIRFEADDETGQPEYLPGNGPELAAETGSPEKLPSPPPPAESLSEGQNPAR